MEEKGGEIGKGEYMLKNAEQKKKKENVEEGKEK